MSVETVAEKLTWTHQIRVTDGCNVYGYERDGVLHAVGDIDYAPGAILATRDEVGCWRARIGSGHPQILNRQGQEVT